MKNRSSLAGFFAVWLTVFGLGACTAEQTQPGEAPDVDVDVDPGRWPEYKVNWADVDVGTTQRTVTVPTVKVVEEQRQVSVPYIDINPPGATDREERTVTMEVDVPNAGTGVEITEIRASENNLWVIGRLTESGQAATPAAKPGAKPAAVRAVTRASDQVVINAPQDLDVRKVIVGQRPEGVYNQQYRFVGSMNELNIPSQARVIYQRGQGTM